MNISVFDVIGPIMIGPSSSHTAGAVRLALVAALIADKPFSHVSFGLHGSFARTYKGHGTDKALLAGVMGLRADDNRLRDAYNMASACGLTYSFSEIELQDVHENSVLITFYINDGSVCEVVGSSIGGGRIEIRRINDFITQFAVESTTLVIGQVDKKGVVSELTQVLADNDINIGVMKLSHLAKGDLACCIIETDSTVPAIVLERLRSLPNILSVLEIDISEENRWE